MTKAKSGFNLASLDTISACNKPFEVEIKTISGMPTGFFISVLGKDSDTYRNIVRSMADETMRRQATGKNADTSLEKMEKKNIDALVAVTTGWRFGNGNAVPLGEESLEFSPANARRVYTEILPVRQQVQEAVDNLENFISA